MMTNEESKELLRELFIAFPYAGDFLQKSTYPAETHAAWCKMLCGVDIRYARAAIDKWTSGELSPPDKPWEMGMLPLKIRAVAATIADKAAQAERQRKVQEESDYRSQARGRSNCGRLMQCSLDAGSMYRDGLLTAQRNKEIVAELCSQVGRSDGQVDVPIEIQEWRRRGSKSIVKFDDIHQAVAG